MKMLLAGFSLAVMLASPAFAQSYDAHPGNGRAPSPAAHAGYAQSSPYSAYGAVTPFGSPTSGANGATHMSGARAAAIHQCNAAAAKFTEHTWGDNEFQVYRACMAQHGQPE